MLRHLETILKHSIMLGFIYHIPIMFLLKPVYSKHKQLRLGCESSYLKSSLTRLKFTLDTVGKGA